MIKIGIIGITGFTGLELLKILSLHKDISLEYIASRSENGKRIGEVYPQFDTVLPNKIESIDIDKIKRLDAVFLSLPHTVSMEIAKDIYGYVKIIDLSADFRLSNVDTYKLWYKKEHLSKSLLDNAVYGLTELNRNTIKTANLIANPGCYATSVILPLAPLADLINTDSIIADSKSGVSGAGRKAKDGLQFCEVNENFKAYSVAKHRHMPEIEETLSRIYAKDIKITFTPHLLPVQRGILSTIYADLEKSVSKNEVLSVYKEFYKNDFFIRIKEELPSLNSVKGTNFCDISFEIDKRSNRIVIVSVIDNMVKGASGQAVQNFNVMFDFQETEGLFPYPYYP